MSTIQPSIGSAGGWQALFAGDSSVRLRAFDLIERFAILVLYAFFLSRMLTAFLSTWNVGNLLMLVTESILVGFIICRKSANNLSLRWSDWFLAFGATSLPLLAKPQVATPHLWNDLAVILMFLGLFIQVVSKFALGRRFGVVAANRGLCLYGPYRLVRHPIYMGYLFTHIGLCLLNPSPWNLVLFACVYALQIPRIWAEERMLNEDESYQQYTRLVRFRLIPGVF
jgi:protein-S-isoprenylcysteine O-methyltransferase Ste14